MEPTPIMNVDTERTSEASIVLPLDPFNIREGFLTEEQIAELRRRRKGKQVAKFYERQNDVNNKSSRLVTSLTTSSLFVPSSNQCRSILKMPGPKRMLPVYP